MKDVVFGHIDINYFYAACHILFRPDLADKPVAILSNNDTYVISANPAAKNLGVARGTSLFQLHELLRQKCIHVYSSTYPLYADMSRRFMDILTELVPAAEYYSIDESFCDLTAVPIHDRVIWAKHIREVIKERLGLNVAVGLGKTKTLAKLANAQAKARPDGVVDLSSDSAINDILAATRVEEIWGIGPRLAQRLSQDGVSSALQLTQAPDDWIRRRLHLPGVRLTWELRGYSVLPLLQVPPPAHSIVRARSFGRPVSDVTELHEAMVVYLSRASEHLRAQRRAATLISVFITTSSYRRESYYSNSYVITLPQPTNTLLELLPSASKALARIFRSGHAYIKLGIGLLELVPESPSQRSLFESPETWERQRKLAQVVDELNRRFGQDTIRLASVGTSHAWQRRMGYPSPRWTTRWEELPLVFA